jgi:hypothetical protein
MVNRPAPSGPLGEVFMSITAWVAVTYEGQRRPYSLKITLDNGEDVRLPIPLPCVVAAIAELGDGGAGGAANEALQEGSEADWHLTEADEVVMQFMRGQRTPLTAREVRDSLEEGGVDVLSESCVQKSLRKLVVLGLVTKNKNPKGYLTARTGTAS